MKTFIINMSKIGILLCFIFLSSCDKGFDEINIDPDETTAETAPASNIFLRVIEDIADETYDEDLAVIADLVGFVFGDGIALYEKGSAGKWGSFYGELKNVNQILTLTAPDGREANSINHGVARILRVIYYQRLVDLFGAIPYTEGAQGLQFPKPKYDSEETIYKDLVKELDAAIAEINTGTGLVFNAEVDLVYGGNAANWALFANSLKLRIGMRMRFVDQAAASTIITNALSGSLINSNEASWAFKYPGTEANNSSDLFSINKPTSRFVSELLLKELRDTNDPRKFVYADPTGNSNDLYQGQVNGLNINFGDATQSIRGSYIWQNRAFPSYLMTHAEVNFLKAEAALANIGGGDANTAFRAGIRASMEQWDVAEADIVTFLATPTATLTGTDEEKLEQIAIQKWIALYTNGHEAYAEMRRTGYPAIAQRVATTDIDRFDADGNLTTVSVGYRLGITEGVFPRRVEYPNNEKELNPDNFNAAVSAYGDGLLDRVWWDVR
ncbi:SusD/RagB family nutrient-binding outer membrane lipoprotein [Flavivirga spongiicola]|uniref:SusD/RagB family nutrient-binding outer membrane lipoprotein n=1 Tax=Flavivirga spongiicola TaxID=421621 RepID=A0ABU7XPI0_9FLAO|nr:SusD/RagB family nutrient-binding outer membrane lipoprotein [Flavivirga sp. MEBiC05379]MDO5977431.1 SusD/RagB family nutrient-binding outer membrane lipoprotein [Flavivirga sp. MEBiC05379]